jgi:4-hydroxybenzoate polyprenyltransferase
VNKYIELLRPRHLVGCAIIFLFGTAMFFRINGYVNNIPLGLTAFLLTYSSVYVFNDLMDLEKDKKHYIKWKRERPLPKGSIKPSTAKKTVILNLSLGLILSSLINPGVLLLNSLLFSINFVYSYFHLKEKAVISIILITSLQFLKVINGWLINGLIINNFPLTIPLMYAGAYGFIILFYKGKWFKNEKTKKALIGVIGILVLSFMITSLILYPFFRRSMLIAVIVFTPGVYLFMKFVKDIDNNFSLKKTILFNFLFLLCLLF